LTLSVQFDATKLMYYNFEAERRFRS